MSREDGTKAKWSAHLSRSSPRCENMNGCSLNNGIHPTCGVVASSGATDSFPPAGPLLAPTSVPPASGLTSHGPYASTTFSWIWRIPDQSPEVPGEAMAFMSLKVRSSKAGSLDQIFLCWRCSVG
jgi:hypothetical protein